MHVCFGLRRPLAFMSVSTLNQGFFLPWMLTLLLAILTTKLLGSFVCVSICMTVCNPPKNISSNEQELKRWAERLEVPLKQKEMVIQTKDLAENLQHHMMSPR